MNVDIISNDLLEVSASLEKVEAMITHVADDYYGYLIDFVDQISDYPSAGTISQYLKRGRIITYIINDYVERMQTALENIQASLLDSDKI